MEIIWQYVLSLEYGLHTYICIYVCIQTHPRARIYIYMEFHGLRATAHLARVFLTGPYSCILFQEFRTGLDAVYGIENGG